MTADIDARVQRVHGMLDAWEMTPDELIAALRERGEDAADTAAEAPHAAATPTVAAYIPVAAAAHTGNTARTYATYWLVLADGVCLPPRLDADDVDAYLADARRINAEKDLGLPVPARAADCPRLDDGRWRLAPGHGGVALDQVPQTAVRVLAKWVLLHACAKGVSDDRARYEAGRASRGWDGKGAQRNFLEAVRSLYNLAAGDGLVSLERSPAHGVAKPPRGAARPQTMTPQQLADVWATASTTGNDPELDAMIVRLHHESGARQEGAINLKLRHLDVERQTVWLDQKGDKLHEVPVSDELLEDLAAFAASRGSTDPDDPVLRYKGRDRHTGEAHPPLTRRRYNTLSKRVNDQHAWARRADWQPYWLRHQAAAEVEQVAGSAVKREFLGHKVAAVSDRYGAASLEHVAWAAAMRTGRPHPLAERPPWA